MVDIAIRQIEAPGVDSVIKHGYCVVCGPYAAIQNAKYEMVMTPYGALEARPLDKVTVCHESKQS